MSATVKRILILLGALTGVFSATLGYNTHGEDLIGWALLVLGILGAAAGSIYLSVTMYHKSIRLDRRDDLLWLLLPGAMVVGLGSPLEFQLMEEVLPRTTLLQIGGIVISFLGVLLVLFGGKLIQRLPEYGDALSTPQTYPKLTDQQSLLMSTGLWLAVAGVALGYSSRIGLAACFILLLPGAILRYNLEKK